MTTLAFPKQKQKPSLNALYTCTMPERAECLIVKYSAFWQADACWLANLPGFGTWKQIRRNPHAALDQAWHVLYKYAAQQRQDAQQLLGKVAA